MRKIALCLDKRLQGYTITLYVIAKKYEFLEIIQTGTYRQLLQAKREIEAPAPAQDDYKKL